MASRDKLMKKLAAAREDINSRGGGGVDRFKIGEDETKKFRVLPVGVEDDELFFKETGTHRVNNKPNKCPKVTYDEDCPICEEVEELFKSSEAEDKEYAKKLRARSKWAIWVIDRTDSKLVPRLWEAPKSVIDPLIRDFMDEEYDDILDFESGRDYQVTRSGKGLDTTYDVSPRPKSSPMLPDGDVDECQEMVDSIPDWEEVIKCRSYDELADILDGSGGGDDDGGEDNGGNDSSNIRDQVKNRLRQRNRGK